MNLYINYSKCDDYCYDSAKYLFGKFEGHIKYIEYAVHNSVLNIWDWKEIYNYQICNYCKIISYKYYFTHTMQKMPDLLINDNEWVWEN